MLGNVPCPSCNGGKEFACVVGEEDLPRLRAGHPTWAAGGATTPAIAGQQRRPMGFPLRALPSSPTSLRTAAALKSDDEAPRAEPHKWPLVRLSDRLA